MLSKDIKYTVYNGFHANMMLPAVYGAVVFSLAWTPMDTWFSKNTSISLLATLTNEQPQHFSRQFGQALINGIDISKRVSNMTFYAFCYIPILFFLCWMILSWLFRKKEISEEGTVFLRSVVLASLPAVVVTVFCRLDYSAVFDLLSPVAYLAVFSVLLYMRFGDQTISLEGFKWALFTAIPVTVLVVLWLNMSGMELLRSTISTFLVEGAVFSVAVTFFCFCAAVVSNKPYANAFYAAHVPLYAAPALTAILLELVQILNQHGIFLTNKLFLSVLLSLLCTILGLTWYIVHARYFSLKTWNYQKAQYPLLVLGLVMLTLRPAIQTIAWNELFETSNAGSDVYAFLVDGEIPLVENLNVHMLLEELGNILYGWLNHDALGAVWYGYPIIEVATYIVLYWLLKELAGREYACLTMVLFPVEAIVWLLSYSFCLIPVAAAAYLVRRGTKTSHICFVLSCMLACLYRADVGISCGVAALLVLTCHLLVHKNYKGIRTVWLAGIMFGIACAALFFALCWWRGISPIPRILEAVSILTDSNTNWAYANVSLSYGFTFLFSYLIMPVAGVLCAIAVFTKWRQEKASTVSMLTVLSLAVAQMIEFSRGIVRHNMLEGRFEFQLGLCLLAVVIAVWTFAGESARHLPLFLSIFFVIQVLIAGEIQPNNTLLQASINRQLSAEETVDYEKIVDRVIIPPEITESSDQLSALFDSTLTSEQSFLDYSYQTTLYALTNRNKPVYTNQSPSQLNHEFDHLLFIKEVQEIDCPYAVSMTNGVGFDGIDSDMAHYLVAEYMYSHYRPVCIIGPYCIWTRNAEFDSRRSQIIALINRGAITAEIVDENLDAFYRRYDLGTVPYLWGTYDEAKPQELLKTLAQTGKNAVSAPALTPTKGANAVEYSVSEDWMPEQYSAPRVAVWCDVNGQDDLIWYNLDLNDERQYEIAVSTADHMEQTGIYHFHLYCSTEEEPNLFLSEVTTELPNALNKLDYALTINDLDREDGNYIELLADAVDDGQAQINLLSAEGRSLCTVTFNIYEGQNRYLIRISANQMWYTEAPAVFDLQTSAELRNIQVNILRGDVDYDSMNTLQSMVLRQDLHLNAKR